MSDYTGGPGIQAIIRKRTGKAPFTRVAIEPAGPIAVVHVFTCKPDTVQARRTPELISDLERVIRKSVTIEITPEARAIARYVRVSPTKARRVLNTIQGKYVDQALGILQFTPNRAARAIAKVLRSAAANAADGWGAEPDELKVSRMVVGAGPTMKRIQPQPMGRAFRILKRSSHIEMAVQDAPRRERKGVRQRPRRAQVRRADRS
jgi:large subunit ribosomal protein L22